MRDVSEWKEFKLSDYFNISAGHYYYPDEYDEGNTPYVSASNANNGIAQYIDLPPDFQRNCIVTGKVGCTAFYQSQPFCATSDVNVFEPKFNMTPLVGLFVTSIINFNENYKWAYGRQCRVGNSKKIVVKLPATTDGEPDWDYMDSYMKSLHSEPLTTTREGSSIPLDADGWKTFRLNQLFDIKMGNGFDKNKMTDDNPSINFVSRISYDNGVDWVVDRVEGVEPFSSGLMTVALGGSYLGHAFIQLEPFYTAQNVAVMKEKYEEMNFYVKLFISSLIRREAGYKYQAFGRELNSHINRDFTVDLPIKENGLPDWEWMETYIKSLPMAEHLPNHDLVDARNGIETDSNTIYALDDEEPLLLVAEEQIEYSAE